jgi:hypothetical protein
MIRGWRSGCSWFQRLPNAAARNRMGGAQRRSFETEVGFERNGLGLARVELACRGITWGGAEERGAAPGQADPQQRPA